jgi:hypothetical protein
MSIYLATYRPLISTPEGQRAVVRFNIPPYVDGSCRREPDFECEFPSISALCRGELFAPHLNEGDEIVYITTKDFYGEAFRHWRVVAGLKVLKRFASHPDAATWYREANRQSSEQLHGRWQPAVASQPHIAWRFKLRARLRQRGSNTEQVEQALPEPRRRDSGFPRVQDHLEGTHVPGNPD